MRKQPSIIKLVLILVLVSLGTPPLPPARAGNPTMFAQNYITAASVTPSFGQQTTASGTGTQVLSSVSLSANDALVLCIAAQSSGETFTVTDNNGGTWNHVTGTPATNGVILDMWYSVGHAAGATGVTITPSAGTPTINANLSVYSQVATASAVDIQTTATGTATTSGLTGTATNTHAFDLLVGCTGYSAAATISSISDYGTSGGTPTALTSAGLGAASGLAAAYQLAGAPTGGTYGMQFNTSSGTYAGAILALKPLHEIDFVQQAVASGKAVTPITATLAANSTAGNYLVAQVVFMFFSPAHSVSTITGTAGTGWTKLVSTASSTTKPMVEIWIGSANVGTTVIVTPDASATFGVNVSEWKGLTTTTDGTSSSQGTAGPAANQPGNITTTNTSTLNLLISVAIGDGSGDTLTNPGSPWVGLTGFSTSGGSGGSNFNAAAIYQLVNSTGSYNPTFTMAQLNTQGAAMVAIKGQ